MDSGPAVLPTLAFRHVVALALGPTAVLLLTVLWMNEGHFTYTLDDPYIHLALARHLLHGHYGLHPSEVSAPSSSILWPFLLAPFSALPRVFEAVPLAINALCLTASLGLLARQFAAPSPLALATVVSAVAVGLNLYGLVFTGLEHSLQLLLVLAIVDGLAEVSGGRRASAGLYPALILLPLVRYEGLAITAPVLGYLLLSGDRVRPLAAGALCLALLGGFSLWLHGLGLGWLPTSVIAKSSDAGGWHLQANAWNNTVRNPGLVLWGALLVAWVGRRDPLLAGAGAVAILLHVTFGKTGWFGRYESYIAGFVVVLALREATRRWPWGWTLLLLVPCSFPGMAKRLVDTPRGSQNIHAQHGQMAGIVQILDEPVAVNDIGLVALRSRRYVLDLWGLASTEALRLRQENPQDLAWAGDLMARRGVEVAMVYQARLGDLPDRWRHVGTLGLTRALVSPEHADVALFAMDAAAEERLRRALEQYQECCSTPLARLTLEPGSP